MLRRGTPFLDLARLFSTFVVVASFLIGLALPRAARADQPGAHTVPVAVLAFDSEDAEDQADALTGALRSRIRAAQGWSLIETTQSLGMMTAAFKCPARPTPECQQKIAEQIKAERYIFGFVAKGPTSGQVTAEIHLYQKGKADTVLKEVDADNLKDANDDTLRKIAARIVERLGGTAVGVIVVKSSESAGEVVVDGEKHVPLDKGTARIELAAGGHSVEVASASGSSSKRNIIVTAGRETVVEFTGTTATTEPPPPAGKSNTRKIVGGATMGVGAVLGAVAVIELVRYLDQQSKGDDRRGELDKNDPINGGKNCVEYDTKCKEIDSASKVASGLAIGFGAGAAVALGVGAYIFFSDPGSGEKTAATKTRLVPSLGAGSGSLTLVGSF
ncbi:hypothetical protein BH11MYX4_BH11MYX4_25800 [soil metagenome]